MSPRLIPETGLLLDTLIEQDLAFGYSIEWICERRYTTPDKIAQVKARQQALVDEDPTVPAIPRSRYAGTGSCTSCGKTMPTWKNGNVRHHQHLGEACQGSNKPSEVAS